MAAPYQGQVDTELVILRQAAAIATSNQFLTRCRIGPSLFV